MMSEANTRRLLIAAGGLAAVGVASLGATFLASDGSTSEPAVATSVVSTTVVVTTIPSTAPATTTTAAPATTAAPTTVATTAPPLPPPMLRDGDVWVFNGSQQQVAAFDFESSKLLEIEALPRGFAALDYQSNGGTATLFDSSTGQLWIGPSSELVGTTFPVGESTTLLNNHIVVTDSGDVWTVGKAGLIQLDLDEAFNIREGEPTVISLPAELSDDTTATAVGEDIVFLNPADGTVFGLGWSNDVEGDNPVLQQAGPAGDTVLVASSTGLYEIRMNSDDEPTALHPASGSPARPVRSSGCVYAAWSDDDSTWVQKCPEHDALVSPLADIGPDDALVFRVSSGGVALNAVGSGAVWVESEFPLAKVVDVWSSAVGFTS